MRYFKLDLLTLLVSLFILSSCEKEGTIGLDIAPQDSINSVFTDTISINTSTVKEDSVLTSNIAQNPFGFINDPELGTTDASLIVGLSLPSDNFSFGTNPQLDSAILVLKYGDEFYGDSVNSTYAVNVHQLDNPPFSSSKSYYNTAVWNIQPDRKDALIGTIPKFLLNVKPKILRVVKGGKDTLAFEAPHLRIRLKSDFILNRFLLADPSLFKNNTAFANHIKGLSLKINQSSSTGSGGLVFFNLQSGISGLEIYYKNAKTGGGEDTSMVVFGARGVSTIKHAHKAAILTQTSNPTQNYSTVYAQPLGGLRTKLKFPHIKKLKEQLGNLSVNKAELVVSVVSGSDNPLKPAPRLALYRTDIAGQRQAVPDNAIGFDPRFLDEIIFGGFYNSTNKTYTFNISSYIQDLINKPNPQYDIYIAPIDVGLTRRGNIFPDATTAARSVLGGKGHPQVPIKLKLTYIKPN